MASQRKPKLFIQERIGFQNRIKTLLRHIVMEISLLYLVQWLNMQNVSEKYLIQNTAI